MWIIKLITIIVLVVLALVGSIMLLIPCFLMWRWSKPYTAYIDGLERVLVSIGHYEG
jgi:hypothetical protein